MRRKNKYKQFKIGAFLISLGSFSKVFGQTSSLFLAFGTGFTVASFFYLISGIATYFSTNQPIKLIDDEGDLKANKNRIKALETYLEEKEGYDLEFAMKKIRGENE